eukprot:CAMPEP_0114554928 /NCGR_PEP_ID=MMETSP0114-20121206/8473_1 /TAXON_ID=31324 /ORGANISM="Goniomonas sp, Strain m" /LENGTH=119 /DNA_ID=CAMNT_0001740011 /DNA_START=36 /DNA_END=392 /DNA_ORIENTATION=-
MNPHEKFTPEMDLMHEGRAQAGASRGTEGLGMNRAFSQGRQREISRENEHLLERLSRVAVRGGEVRRVTAAPAPKKKPSSQSINRRREEERIAKENARMAQRLGKVKSATCDKKTVQQW